MASENPDGPLERKRRGPYLQWLDPVPGCNLDNQPNLPKKIPKTTKWNQQKEHRSDFIQEDKEHSDAEELPGTPSGTELSNQGSTGSSDGENGKEEEYCNIEEQIVTSRGNILPPCASDGISLERGEEIEILSDGEVTDLEDGADDGNNIEGNSVMTPGDDDHDVPHGETLQTNSDNNAGSPGDMVHDNKEAEGTPGVFSGFEFLKQTLQNETFSSPIRDRITCYPGEVLLMALAVAKEFCLPVEGLTAILKLVNGIFAKSVVPDTRYKLDKLLCGDKPSYHFYCKNCTQYLGGKTAEGEKNIVCPNCSTSNQVSNLCDATYFVTIDIAEQLQLLMQNEGSKLKKPADAVANYDGTIRDIYDGAMYRKFVESLPDDRTCQYASLAFCTDGTPLYKSSKVSMWPITVMVLELDRSVRSKNVLLAGLWCGPSKPPMGVFLEPFVRDMNRLSSARLQISLEGNQVVMKLCTISCTLDSVARCPSQGISQHNGEFPCNWCLHPGERQEDNSNKFPLLADGPPPPRTQENIITHARELAERRSRAERVNGKPIVQVYGVRSMTPLVTMDFFDIVEGMVDDVMHCGWLGIARQLAKPWLDKPTEGLDCYVGSPTNLAIIDKRLRELTVPVEARRLTRSVTEMCFWKAKEWENWTLFYSVPVMSGILPDRFLANWALFVEAMHILHGTRICPDDVSFAEELLVRFVAGVETLYGVSHATFNVHISLHLSINVINWGPLSELNAYAFESVNGELKRVVHANKGVIQQVCRVLSNSTAMEILTNSLTLSPRVKSFLTGILNRNHAVSFPFEGGRAFGKSSPFIPSEEEIFLCSQNGEIDPQDCVTYAKAIINGSLVCTSSRKRTNNTVVLLHDGSFVKVKQIVVNERNRVVFLFASLVRTRRFLRGVHLRGIIQLVTHIEDELLFVSKNSVKIVAFSSVSLHGEVVIPMPSVCSTS